MLGALSEYSLLTWKQETGEEETEVRHDGHG